jgi:dihydrofolate synthase/folylpolyglutamate synthase
MDCAEARCILENLPTLEVKPGLARINRLLDALDHPQQTFQTIHVAGTNGKGSVVAMLASVLHQAGYKVGRFTSPELLDFRDRICVGDTWIAQQELAIAVERLLPILNEEKDRPTLFEALTAIAFDHFAAEHVDLAVIEAGLGGRFDATNTVAPMFTILTNVGLDHMGLLGSRLEQITWEKAGIAKRQVPFLMGDLPPVAEKVAVEECRLAGGRLVRLDPISVRRSGFDWERTTYAVEAEDLPKEIDLPLLGGYQRENLRLALRAVQSLREQGVVIPNDAVAAGLGEVRWPGRFEVVLRDPTVVLDGAHNVPAVQALAKDVGEYAPEKRHRHLLFGVLSDKEWEAISRILFPLFAEVTLTRSQSPRALSLDVLGEAASLLGVSFACCETVSDGLTRACSGLVTQDVLLVAGSLSVVREARLALVEVPCRL